jgi:hypothetical protein
VSEAAPLRTAAEQRRLPPVPAPPARARLRCAICDFPLAAAGQPGCRPGQCSQRQECLSAVLGCAEEVPIPYGPRARVVPRGHCDRCDRCGFAFAPAGQPGCHPGQCAQTPIPPPRDHCSRCHGRYPLLGGPRRLPPAPRIYLQLRLPLDPPDLELPERSLHPDKITNRERATWMRLPHGWDQAWVPNRDACRDGPRPCPWIRCKHHTYIEVSDVYGTVRLNFPDVPPDQMDRLIATCTLDEADKAEAHREKTGRLMTLQKVADRLGMTLERARQIQGDALRKIGPEGARVIAARLKLPVLDDG